MSTNARFTVGVSNHSSARTLRQARVHDMEALALLPLAVRRYIGEFTFSLSAVSVLLFYQGIRRQCSSDYEAEVYTLRKLAQIEGLDLDAFAAKYEAKHKTPYPHKAAGVPVLRYGALIARRGRGRIRVPVEISEAA